MQKRAEKDRGACDERGFRTNGRANTGPPPALESDAPITSDLGCSHDRGQNMTGGETVQTWPALRGAYTAY